MIDFFFRLNKCTYALLQIPKRLYYWITTGILCLIMIVWFICVYQTVQSYIHANTAQVTALTQLQNTKKSLQIKNKQLRKKSARRIATLQQDVNRHKRNHKSIHEVLRIVFQLAQKNNLTILNHTPLETIQKKWYTSHLFHTDYTGDFNQILSFFSALHEHNLTHIKKVTLSSNSNNLTLSLLFSITDIKEPL